MNEICSNKQYQTMENMKNLHKYANKKYAIYVLTSNNSKYA